MEVTHHLCCHNTHLELIERLDPNENTGKRANYSLGLIGNASTDLQCKIALIDLHLTASYVRIFFPKNIH